MCVFLVVLMSRLLSSCAVPAGGMGFLLVGQLRVKYSYIYNTEIYPCPSPLRIRFSSHSMLIVTCSFDVSMHSEFCNCDVCKIQDSNKFSSCYIILNNLI